MSKNIRIFRVEVFISFVPFYFPKFEAISQCFCCSRNVLSDKLYTHYLIIFDLKQLLYNQAVQ